jgi:hypothetical protein
MSYLNKIKTEYTDSGNLDSFGRLRISNPVSLFDYQMTYRIDPFIWETVTTGTGSTVTHHATNRNAVLSFDNTATGGLSLLQTYQYFPYLPGRSQLVFATFNFLESANGVTKFIGYSDGTNGIEFQLNGNIKQFVIYSSTENGNQTITQNNWNIDKFDGTGRSGINLDISKTQILVVDFQALYVGRVRVGFDINGVVYYVHEFLHANMSTNSYIATANLPLRVGMTNTATATTSMNFICSTILSEGGTNLPKGTGFTARGSVTATNNARTHLLSVRPASLYQNQTNRVLFTLESIDILVTGNNSVYWELVIGQGLSGINFLPVDLNNSAFEYDSTATIGVSLPSAVIASGFVSATNQSKSSTQLRVDQSYPITLTRAGTQRISGRISLLVTGLGANTAVQGVLNWVETR